jgi:hypothetical protein
VGKPWIFEWITITYLVREKWFLSKIFGFSILSRFQSVGMFLQSGSSGVKNYFGEPEYYGPKPHKFLIFEFLVKKEVVFGRFAARDFTLAPDSDELQKKGRNILLVKEKGKTTMYYS